MRTLTVSIFTTWLNQGSLAGAAQISCLMLFVVAALVLLERYGRAARVRGTAESPRIAERTQLAGSRLGGLRLLLHAAAVRLCPALRFLLRQSIQRSLIAAFDALVAGDRQFDRARDASHDRALLLGLCDHLPIAGATARRPSRYVAQAGYAVPGLILALGLLTPLVAFDNVINALAGWARPSPPGLLIAGSSAAVVIAYAIRFMAVATGLTQAGFERIPRDYDDSANMSGASEWTACEKSICRCCGRRCWARPSSCSSTA